MLVNRDILTEMTEKNESNCINIGVPDSTLELDHAISSPCEAGNVARWLAHWSSMPNALGSVPNTMSHLVIPALRRQKQRHQSCPQLHTEVKTKQNCLRPYLKTNQNFPPPPVLGKMDVSAF